MLILYKISMGQPAGSKKLNNIHLPQILALQTCRRSTNHNNSDFSQVYIKWKFIELQNGIFHMTSFGLIQSKRLSEVLARKLVNTH